MNIHTHTLYIYNNNKWEIKETQKQNTILSIISESVEQHQEQEWEQ